MSADFDPNAVYKAMSNDELADLCVSLKGQAADLRNTIWKCEDELRNRLIANNAKRLQGEAYLIRSSVKREIVWNDDALSEACRVAMSEDRGNLFNLAFPVHYAPRLRELNELRKFGGKTVEAIDAAIVEVKEKIELDFEPLR